ncbi:hypothetical protein U6B65_11045 [Oscillospiraceae bacterium MB08-C2-2]|nr:hypothetical protein U6B65_11045 [Oscillospiraceae bacterium MB08-C2-2]
MKLYGKTAKTTEAPLVGHMLSSTTPVGVSSYAHARMFAPAGIDYLPKSSDKMLILPVDGVNLCLGAPCDTTGLAEGELRLRAKSGAYIHLKSNGEVVINGLRISAQGKIL